MSENSNLSFSNLAKLLMSKNNENEQKESSLLDFLDKYPLRIDKDELSDSNLYFQQGPSISNLSTVRLPPLIKPSELTLREEITETIKENINLEHLKLGYVFLI